MAEAAVYKHFTQAALDKEYNPRETAPDFQDYFDRWDRESKVARAKADVKRDVPYGTGADETLDIYPLGGSGSHPVMVYYHGGYWRRFGKADRGFIAPHMNQAGVLFVSVDYTLAPKATLDEIVAQCRRAMAWVSQNIASYGGDPTRVYICGESAGGHLTAMVAQTDWAKEGVSPDPIIKGALAISGVYDLEPIRHSFLQPDVRLTPEQVQRNSPILHIRKSPVQMMLSVGLVESAEFQRQLNDYSAGMAAAGIRHDMVRVGGCNHFSIVDAMCEPRNMLHLSLMRLMRPDRRSLSLMADPVIAESDESASIAAALRRMGLLTSDAPPTMTPLTGGVSSDILLVDASDGGGGEPFCIKRALAKLKVAADWRAPVARNHAEAEWMRTAGAILPAAVPRVLGEDEALGLFAMPYLAPERHPVWKNLLRDGKAKHETADHVGAALARIHAATADNGDVAARFANDDTFYAIRLEPYLVATGRAHPDLAAQFDALVARTARTKRALVHGDVSPKNILVGPESPVFLDAECAWYGDPAFDAAFCLNHLLLKCLWRPANAARYLDMFDRLAASYLAGATWEARAQLEARTASLLPALMLARVDGKSPVEYITEDAPREQVRRFTRPLIQTAPATLAAIRAGWAREMNA